LVSDIREKHRQRISENRVLRKIFGLKMDEVARDWKNSMMRSFVTCALALIIIRINKSWRMGRAYSMNEN
jgi:hypothetical protein